MQDAANLHKPVFGICYGCQSWNVWHGGSLIQHLNTPVNHKPGREVREAHRVSLAENSRIARITGMTELMVNSSHHQAIATPGDALEVVAIASDGTIEAVEQRGEHFVLGVQWHPERTFAENEASLAIFREFTRAARSWKPRVIRESVAR